VTHTYGRTIAAGGALTYFTAPVTNPSDFSEVDYQTWLQALTSDIESSRQSGGGGALLPGFATFFFHGFGVSFDAAMTDFGTYFTNLASDQGGAYPGVLVGFDWPSNVGFQTAKQNAQTTAAESFPLLAAVVDQIRNMAVYLGAICHSMGNYLMYEGASQLVDNGQTRFDEILCVAAMLESTAFNSPSSMTYCQDIVDAAANRVTLYYSVHDDVLPDAEAPDLDGYPELGIYGPGYDACLLDEVVGVDCSAVVNQANAKKYETGRLRPLTHIAYFFIPETLYDIGQTLLGTTTDEMTDRRPIAGSTVGFMLKDQPQDGGGALAAAGADPSLPWAAVAAAKGDQR
jgi:hypothetical protein